MSYFEQIKAWLFDGSGNPISSSGTGAIDTALHDAAGTEVLLTNGNLPTVIGDPVTADQAEIMTGPFTGEKGLRVFIGPTDPISDIPVFMDFTHHQGHEGESYGVQYYSAAPATRSFGLTVGDYSGSPVNTPNLIMHLTMYGGAGQIDLYEGSTFTGGTAMTSYNRNRNSANVAGMVITDGVTVTVPGTLMPHSFIAAAAEKQGDTNRNTDEIILAENTIYTVVLTEITATTRVLLHFEWYEDLGV